MQSSALPGGSVPPIFRLATELHLNIVAYLIDPDEGGTYAARYLRLTNRHFYNIVEKATHDDILGVEQTIWAIERRLYACKFCIRLRHASKFADAMLKGKTGRNGTQRFKRFCADCGFAPPQGQIRYSRGSEAIVNGERWVWCRLCQYVKKGDAAGRVGCVMTCETCYQRHCRNSEYGCTGCGGGWGRCKGITDEPIEKPVVQQSGRDRMIWRPIGGALSPSRNFSDGHVWRDEESDGYDPNDDCYDDDWRSLM